MHDWDLGVAEDPDPEMPESPSLSDDGTTFILKYPYYHDTPRNQAAISLPAPPKVCAPQGGSGAAEAPHNKKKIWLKENLYHHDTPRTQAAISHLPKVQRSVLRQIDDVMALCSKISENSQIKAAVDNSSKGAAAAGGGAFLGGLLGGPPGIFIGTYTYVLFLVTYKL